MEFALLKKLLELVHVDHLDPDDLDHVASEKKEVEFRSDGLAKVPADFAGAVGRFG